MADYKDIRTKFQVAWDQVNEAKMHGVKNKNLISEISKQSKESQFESYLNNLSNTGGKSYTDTIALLNKLNASDSKIFAEGLAKYKTIEALQPNFQTEMTATSLSTKIFDEKQNIGKGIGPGELWLAWLVEGVRVSGGGESFDVTHNEKSKYEVKSYTGDNAPFRLGNAGAASKFDWLKKLRHLAEVSEEIVKRASLEKTHPELFEVAKQFNSRAEKSPSADFARGEVSKALIQFAIDFINIANKSISERKTGYDIIEVKSTSPGLPNKSYVIEPASDNDLKSGKFTIKSEINMADIQNEEALFRMLVKNVYVREGLSQLVNDINTGINNVENKYKGIKFLVFRKGQMNISTGLMKVNTEDIASVYGGGKDAVFNMSGAILRVREDI